MQAHKQVTLNNKQGYHEISLQFAFKFDPKSSIISSTEIHSHIFPTLKTLKSLKSLPFVLVLVIKLNHYV